MTNELTPFDAVIFDMDGVLIDSEPLWKIAMEEVFHAIGSTLTKQDFQKTVGLRLDEVVVFWHAYEGWKGVTPHEVETKIVLRMVDLIKENASPLPGVVETLRFLQEKNIKVGLATSSYEILISTVLQALAIKPYFWACVSAEHEEFGKPHPAVYLTAAQQLGVQPTQCLVVEDSFNGVISGKAARMKVACIPEKTHHPDHRLVAADYNYSSMLDLLEDLKKLS
jgi:HAD superfamily hydrolase (TIGR01509 family)